ncbi:phosphoethanolamine--lipid A transferase [Ramlibacter sp. G-1-2-2]|uniref:Phosphoethanolamine--lipid A transferase n=1 Tax=Ramlibacter agri TaxID=2728837 RepID=A0A848HGS1_9BURK|nr:phosphoethanolamine--lipid A transferase [Ramlibacter agri]NML48521.1 phosphoethanolamine--lipid A transferase [Ramlibacter agri]
MSEPSHDTRRPRSPAWPVLAASLWMAVLGNAPLWRELGRQGLLAAHGGWLLALCLGGALAAVLFSLLSLLAWPRLLKPAIALLLVATAVGGYYMWTFHVVIDPGMAVNTLQTDWGETRDLLTPQLALVVALGAVLPAWLLWRQPLAYGGWKGRSLRNLGGVIAGLVVAAALVLASFQPLASAMRNYKHLRYLMNPLTSLWSFGYAAVGEKQRPKGIVPLGQDAQLAAKGQRPPLVLLVLGETGRSGNFGLNGYPRDTTPELAKEGVVSFRNAWSCGTSTAASVPCMFSHLGRDGFLARERDSENLVDVLQHAGLAVLWLDNQPGGCKGVCERVPTVNTSDTKDPALCKDGECLDGVLLQGLDARLAALPADKRARGVVLVMHQMGSHGPAYSLRSPPEFKRFQPECTSAHLPDCSVEQVRNAYDNSIAYTDHILASAIDWLKTQNGYDTAFLYVADHGESLGENNLYLHGLPYAIAPDVQKHVPWVQWLSPGFEQRTGLTAGCLKGRVDTRISHDNLFHTVLGLLQVSTQAYQRDLDAYAGCGAH